MKSWKQSLASKFQALEPMTGYDEFQADCWKTNHLIGAILGCLCIWMLTLAELVLHYLWSPLDLNKSLLFSLCNTVVLGLSTALALRAPYWTQKLFVHISLGCVALFSGASAGTVDSTASVPFYWTVGFCTVAVCGVFPNNIRGALGLSGLTVCGFCLGYASASGPWNHSLNGGFILLAIAAPSLAIIGSVTLDTALCSAFNSRRVAEIAKDRLTVTLRDIGDGVIVANSEESIVLFNRKAQEILGWTAQEAEQLQLTELFPWFRELEHVDQPPKEMKTVDREGQEIWLSLTVSRMDGLVLAFQDITERKRLEVTRLRASRLESLGLVAGGIAHDFNNLLTAVLGNSSFLLDQPSLKPEMKTALESIEQASQRAGNLANQLLTFAQGGDPHKEVREVGELVVASSTFALTGSSVKLTVDQPKDLWCAEVDASQIDQVVQNLTINAVQAMPQGGSLTIRGRNVELFQPEDELKPGSYIYFEFRDEGEGIPQEIQEKVFDPYFTTKTTGSGLGLATAYSILSRHGGAIKVESEPGAGTSFKLYIPATKQPPTQPEKRKVATKKTNSGGKILLMDDEDAVRAVLRKMLERMGYQCEESRNGTEAVEKFLEAQDIEPFCCVILDLTIPGSISGEKVLAKLKEIHPEIRSIVASGYAAQGVMADHQAYGFSARLAKPFSLSDLRETLSQVLEGENG